jgi:hypothetical protein
MGPALLTDVFTACFWFGAAATVLSFALGAGQHGPLHLGHIHLPGIGHPGTAHHGAGVASSDASPGISPFNLNSLLVFLTVFGAVGLIVQGGLGEVVAFLLASVAGLIAAWLVFLFLARFLVGGQTFLIDEPIVGTVATVSRAIGTGRVGEIIYTRNNVRHSDGARSVDGTLIPAGEEVVVVDYRRGIAVVQRWREFIGEPSASPELERDRRDAAGRLEHEAPEILPKPTESP